MKYTHYYSPMDEIITNIDTDILYNDIIKNFKNLEILPVCFNV